MRKYLPYIYALFITFLAIQQSNAANPGRAWTKLSGTGQDEGATRMVADSFGSVYLGGYTQGDLYAETNNGSWDGFLVKYSSAGDRLWTELLGTVSSDLIECVSIDSSDNIYVAGHTEGTLDAGGKQLGWDAFVAKYDSTGANQWTKQFGTQYTDLAKDMAADPSGNTYVTGETLGGIDGIPHDPTDKELYLVKYNASGTKQWSKRLGTSKDDAGLGVARTAASDYIYVTGYTDGFLDGNNSSGGRDAILVKYDAAGVKQWTAQFGSALDDWGNGAAVDAAGNIYVTGATTGNLDGGTWDGNYKIFLAKFDSSGAEQWVKVFGTIGKEDVGTRICINASGELYISGWTRGGLDGNLNAGAAGSDIFLMKCDSSGDRHWTKQFGSALDDWNNGSAYDIFGNIYLCGWSQDGLDGITGDGGYDIFLVKYSTATALHLSVTEIDAGSVKRSADKAVSFAVSNYGGGTLNGTISSDSAWIVPGKTTFSANYEVIPVTLETIMLRDGINTGTITADAGDAGEYSITVSVEISGIDVKPNPFKPNSDSAHTAIIFDCHSQNSVIKVFTISRKLVWKKEVTGERMVSWDAKGTDGNNLASGVYTYLILEESGAKRSGKIAIVR